MYTTKNEKKKSTISKSKQGKPQSVSDINTDYQGWTNPWGEPWELRDKRHGVPGFKELRLELGKQSIM